MHFSVKKSLILEDQQAGIDLLVTVIENVFFDSEITHRQRLSAIVDTDANTHDIAFIDLHLPDGFSFELITQLKDANPELPIIVTTLYENDDMVFKALQAGADGYLLKSDGVDKLIKNLNRMLDGEPAISPRIARKLMGFFTNQKQSHEKDVKQKQDFQTLSDREVEVLKMVGKGYLTKEIADKLALSKYTINDNLKAIYKKLNVNTRTQAVSVAMRGGLI